LKFQIYRKQHLDISEIPTREISSGRVFALQNFGYTEIIFGSSEEVIFNRQPCLAIRPQMLRTLGLALIVVALSKTYDELVLSTMLMCLACKVLGVVWLCQTAPNHKNTPLMKTLTTKAIISQQTAQALKAIQTAAQSGTPEQISNAQQMVAELETVVKQPNKYCQFFGAAMACMRFKLTLRTKLPPSTGIDNAINILWQNATNIDKLTFTTALHEALDCTFE
jgi:hypothetical protein